MYAAREQKVIVDGVEITKTTEIVQTNEGFVALETTTLEAQQQEQAVPPMLAIHAVSLPVVIESPPEPKRCCDYGCCECDDNFKWYSCYGKGACIIILLILLYFIGFVVGVALIVVIIALAILKCLFCSESNKR